MVIYLYNRICSYVNKYIHILSAVTHVRVKYARSPGHGASPCNMEDGGVNDGCGNVHVILKTTRDYYI